MKKLNVNVVSLKGGLREVEDSDTRVNSISFGGFKFWYRNHEAMTVALKHSITAYGGISKKILLLYAEKAMYNRKVLKNRYGPTS